MIESSRLRLPVADVERSLRFYVERLGTKLVEARGDEPCIDLGSGFHVVLVQRAEFSPLELDLWVRGDFEEAVATYDNRELEPERGADAFGPFALLRDPDGHLLRVLSAPS